MGTSFVTLGSRAASGSGAPSERTGFWANDSHLALILRLLALHIPEPAADSDGELARTIREQWLLASGVSFPGCVPHGLEWIAESLDSRTIAKSAVASLMVALEGTPRLPGSVFSFLGLGGPAASDIELCELVNILRQMASLLDEQDSEGRSRLSTPTTE